MAGENRCASIIYMKRITISFLVACALIGSAGTASALSVADLQAQIQSLLAQIASLQAQQGSAQSVAPSTESAPDSCQVWYDGCNTCTRSYPGGPLSCTEVQCIWNAGAKCTTYFDSSSGSTGTPRFCALSTRNISRGASGDLVQALQEYLQGQGLLSAQATGYFGAATEAAVQQWQSQQGLVSSGSLYTTGWGGVGPRTWAALKNYCQPIVGGDKDIHGCIGSAGYTWCASLNQCIRSWETTCPAPVACPAVYQPVCGRPNGCANTCPAGSMCPMYCRLNDPQTYSNRCMLDAAGAEYLYSGACTTVANQPPTISGISGPTTLSVNQTGTWSVTASDPENQSLSYQVQWGDEMYYPLSAGASVSSPVNYQTSTFTHSYARAGTYTVSVTVTDAQGQSAQTTTTVTVGSGAVACTMEYAPVCGQIPGCANNPCTPGTVCTMMCLTHAPQTFGNRCALDAAGATYLYSGVCSTTY